MLHFPRSGTRAGWIVRLDLPWHVRYAIAFLLVAIAFGLTWILPPIRTGTPFMFFFLAVSASAFLGNFRTGILAVLLSTLAVAIWIMPPVGVIEVDQDDFFRLVGFVVVATLTSALAYAINRAHRTIYEQAEWLGTTLASIGDAVIATDREGRVVWLNEVAATLTGRQAAEAIGKPLSDVFRIFNEQTRLPVADPVARVLAERRVIGLANHTVLKAQDGSERPVEDSAAPILDAAGQLIGVVLIFHDVSERRARDAALQASEQRLRMALQAGRMVAWEWDVRQARIWTTENFADIYGIPPIELVEQGVQLLHPDDFALHQETVSNAVEGGGYHLQFRIIRPDDGRTVWIEEWGYAVPRPADQPLTHIVGVSVDITERKVADEEIRRLNSQLSQRVQELQALFDLALVGIGVALDASCEVITRNETLARWLGMPKGPAPSLSHPEAAALPFRMLRNGKEADPSTLPMQRAVAEASSIVNQEYEIVRNDGFRLTVVVSATPIFDDEGRVTGCVSTYTDVSERKAAEVALKNLNETLEQRVAERTAELEQINRELVEFTNVVSHDLRAPLRAITALSEWINEEADAVLPASSKEHLAKMRQRVERMERLLNDLAAYTRAGRVHYRQEQVNTKRIAHDIIALLDTQNGFQATIVEPMPTLVTERVPLETVLRNLIGNAYKHHHHPQEGHVSISANDLGDVYEFAVSDDGPGIAPEHQQRIFGVFQTLRPRDVVEGSGMGLAIAKRLVEGRGGQIRVESRTGQGSVFRFTWPKQR